jgi:hypothetical protein
MLYWFLFEWSILRSKINLFRLWHNKIYPILRLIKTKADVSFTLTKHFAICNFPEVLDLDCKNAIDKYTEN